MSPRRLDDLVIEESSGVDSPANMMNGWIVIKAEGAPAEREPKGSGVSDEQRQQISDRLVRLAELQDLAPTPEELAAGVDAVLAGKTDIAAVLQTFTAAEPPPEEPPPPPGKKPPEMTPKQKLASAEAAYRKSYMASDKAVEQLSKVADVLQAGSPRMTREQAIAKAVESADDRDTVMGRITTVARSLVESGVETSMGQAMVTASGVVGDQITKSRRRLYQDGAAAPVRKDVAEASGAVAAEIRVGRAKRGLSQDQLADEVGVSVTTVKNWEAGLDLPYGLNRTRVAGAIGGGKELVTLIDKAREGR